MTKQEYTIVFNTDNLEKDKNTINVIDEHEFIEWFFKNKNFLKQAKLKFITKLEHININSVKCLYKFLKFYQKNKLLCDKHMSEYNKKITKIKENEEINQALNELVRMNSGGKFLRASLIALGYKTTGAKDNKYLNLAIALELFQMSILIHDDIIDNDDIRRGKPTIPCSYRNMYDKPTKKDNSFIEKRNSLANSLGICIGDLGFYLANDIILDGYKNNKNLYRLMSYYNQMVIKTCKGEMLDVILPFTEQFYQNNKNLSNKIMEIYKLKTAWYSVIGPYCLGLILGGAEDKEVKLYEKILLNTGIAFQIKDDILGIYGNSKITGKSNCSDAQEYKQTILYCFTMQTNYKDELLKYYGKKNISEKDCQKIKEIFNNSGALGYAKKTMNDLFQSSLNELDKIDGNNCEILKGFIIYLRHRSK